MKLSAENHKLHRSSSRYIREASRDLAPVDPAPSRDLAPAEASPSRDQASLSSSATAPTAPPASQTASKPWTVLYYGAADNDLYTYISQDVAKMEKVGSDQATNLVVQLAHRGGPTQRFYIQKDQEGQDPNKIDSPVLEDLGSQNMSDPKTLSSFIEWGMKKYPSEHYILVIADHGKGWKGCCADQTHKGWMELPQLKQALTDAQAATGKRLDIIGFDACMMASAEVAYQLKDQARYLVASEEVEGQEGWPYNLILDPNALQTLSMSMAISPHAGEPKQVAQYLVSRTTGDGKVIPTMSAVDLERIGSVASAASELKDAILSEKVNTKELRILRKAAQPFADFNDLHDFADKLVQSDTISSPLVKEKAQQLAETLDSAIIAEQHDPRYPGAHGLTAELRWPKGYDKTDFAKSTGWDKLVNYMNT